MLLSISLSLSLLLSMRSINYFTVDTPSTDLSAAVIVLMLQSISMLSDAAVDEINTAVSSMLSMRSINSFTVDTPLIDLPAAVVVLI
jgi:hypothetical protein